MRACRNTGPQGFQRALACLAALFLLSGASARKEPAVKPPLSLRPTIAPVADVPLPRPRPATAPARPAAPSVPAAAPPAETTTAEPSTAPPAPSACQLRLTPEIAAIEALPPIAGANGCGIDDAVKLSAVMTRDKTRVAISPPATMRCSTAEAIVRWVRDDIASIAAELGGPLGAIANFASYECRGRNRVVGALISEHGKGNALDIRALTLTNGKSYELTDIHVAKPVREKLRASACARFTTVLGPASDGYHEGHVHVDLAERRGGYRICQWAVRDVSDLVPLPRERPAEAPPRQP